MSVPARISIVTLGVSDLGRSAAFYSALAADAHLAAAPRSPFGGITLAINLENEAAVTAALRDAAAAGGIQPILPAPRGRPDTHTVTTAPSRRGRRSDIVK